MTESEAIEYFKNYIEFCEKDGIGLPSKDPYDLAIAALEEIQEYREFKKIFEDHMSKTIINVLSDKNEFAEWLDRVAWNVKKCDELFCELDEYKKLGTVEELRKAAEKRKKKTPYMYGDGYADGGMVYDMYECPGCGESYEIDGEKYDFCPKCGQSIDFLEVEE